MYQPSFEIVRWCVSFLIFWVKLPFLKSKMAISPFFPECGAKGSRLTLGVWGRGVCSLNFSTAVRARALWKIGWGNAPQGCPRRGIRWRWKEGRRRGRRGRDWKGAFGFVDLSCFLHLVTGGRQVEVRAWAPRGVGVCLRGAGECLPESGGKWGVVRLSPKNSTNWKGKGEVNGIQLEHSHFQ